MLSALVISYIGPGILAVVLVYKSMNDFFGCLLNDLIGEVYNLGEYECGEGSLLGCLYLNRGVFDFSVVQFGILFLNISILT